MRLINADDLEVYSTTVPKDCDTDSYIQGISDVLEEIDEMPTVDAIPVEWILLYIQEYPYMTASSMLHYWSLDQAIERKEE